MCGNQWIRLQILFFGISPFYWNDRGKAWKGESERGGRAAKGRVRTSRAAAAGLEPPYMWVFKTLSWSHWNRFSRRWSIQINKEKSFSWKRLWNLVYSTRWNIWILKELSRLRQVINLQERETGNQHVDKSFPSSFLWKKRFHFVLNW